MSDNIEKEDLMEIVDESIALELNVGEVYKLFSAIFPEDNEFWWKIAIEEKNHASLLRSGKDYYSTVTSFPSKIFISSIEDIKSTNNYLVDLKQKFLKDTPTREEAFNTAYKIENSAVELHFQEFMEKEQSSRIEEIFQKLNREDKNHAIRIEKYMKDNNIEIEN